MEENMQVLEGAQYRLRVKLNNEAGELLPPELFLVYAGAFCPGHAPAHFHAERTANEWVLTMPGLKPGRVPWNWQLLAAEYATGVEWLLAAGEITVTPRLATGSGSVAPGELEIVATLDKTTQEITVELGDSTASVAENARRAAQAALDSQTARGDAEAAKEDAVMAKGDAEKAKDDAEKAKDDAVLAKGDAEKAKDDAVLAKGDAEKAKDDAVLAKDDAVLAKDDAVLAKGDAEKAKDDAVLAKTAAEKAKQDAQAAQTKAEQDAGRAEQKASLLGDAALKSADNTFTGLNTFNGEVAGVLPWDFHAYSWCKNKEELWAACPDIEQRRVFYADLSSMAQDGGGVRLLPKNVRKAILYFSGDILGDYVLGEGLKDIVIFAPNATKCGNIIAGDWEVKSRFMVYAPKCAFSYRSAMWGYIKTVIYISKMERLMYDSLGNGYSHTESLIMPFNVVKKIELGMHTGLWNVPYGFPHATYIDFNKTKFNKASVMALLNDLKPYDAATMTKVPELSIGIDPALDGDDEINAALLNAQESVENGGKGWNVAVAGFTVTAGGGATMALRRPIYAMRREDAEGAYIDADGTRWRVRYGNTVLENWAANEELGYTEFPSLEAALAEWGLTEYVPEETTIDY